MRVLSKVAKIDHGQEDLLGIKDGLFNIGGASRISLSSQKEMEASIVEGCFRMGLDLPKVLPEFAIGVFQSGNNTYCIIIDKRRRLIVRTQVGGIYAETGWEGVEISIKSALRLAEENRKTGKPYRFIMADDDSARAV